MGNDENNNILLCDANFCVLPILENLKRWNLNVTIVGVLDTDPGHHLANRSVKIDYSDVVSLDKNIGESVYAGIVPGCNDRAYLSLAEIADKKGFPGYDKFDTVLKIHLKHQFRKFAEQQNYPIPKAVDSIEKIEALKFPVLVKPVDSFSGKGVNKANSLEELSLYWETAKENSKSGLVLAEEFVEGNLYSHSAFIKNKKILIDFFVNEYCTVYPYQVNSSNLSTLISDTVKQKLRDWLETFAQDLDLCDGLVHTQFISDNNTFHLIEVARRCPGDLYSQLIKRSTGVDYAALYAMPFCNIPLPDTVEVKENNFISRHTVSTDEDCVFISAGLEVECVGYTNIQLMRSGDILRAAPYGKSGIYLIEHNSSEAMECLTEKLKDYVVIETLDTPLQD